MKHFLSTFFLLILLLASSFSQSIKAQDSLSLINPIEISSEIKEIKWTERKSFKAAVVPAGLSTAALTILAIKDKCDLSKFRIQREFQEEYPRFKTDADDHFRYIPVAMVYGLNLAGKRGKNSFAERTILLTKSLLLQHILVAPLKNGFKMERPNGGTNSFPSSHTARAFVAATFMHHEFGDQSIWYSIAGYSFAVATGALRMVNNHHWLPDVLIGAGIGILSTNLAYLTHQYKWTKWMNYRKGKTAVTFVPTFSDSAPGLYLSVRF